MRTEDELILSFYRELNCISKRSNVYLVQHIETNRVYIRKTLSSYDKSLYLALQKLHVPGIPEIFHLIEDGEQLIVIEEYINGEPLADFLSRSAPLSPEAAAGYIRQLCRILHTLHGASPAIIHRDIKPENIILTSDDRLFLIDFNASKAFAPGKTQDTVLMGTVEYAAPEQFGFSQSDARTDIYALGILFNVMLTGTFPKQQLYRGRLSRVIRKCIHMDPARRYPTVSQLEKALSDGGDAPWYLPPGFRSKNIGKMIIAAAGYSMILYLSATLTVEETSSVFILYVNRIAVFLWMLGFVLLGSDYLGIHSRLPFTRSPRLPVKILGVCLWGFISLIFFVLLTLLLEDFCAY